MAAVVGIAAVGVAVGVGVWFAAEREEEVPAGHSGIVVDVRGSAAPRLCTESPRSPDSPAEKVRLGVFEWNYLCPLQPRPHHGSAAGEGGRVHALAVVQQQPQRLLDMHRFYGAEHMQERVVPRAIEQVLQRELEEWPAQDGFPPERQQRAATALQELLQEFYLDLKEVTFICRTPAVEEGLAPHILGINMALADVKAFRQQSTLLPTQQRSSPGTATKLDSSTEPTVDPDQSCERLPVADG